jgi:hypothetical protein
MSQDRELLELAARAAGLPDTSEWTHFDWDVYGWNPLNDDGDAFRLAVKLRLKVTLGHSITMVEAPGIADVGVEHYEGAEVATRRAILRAAAEIGRLKPQPERSS